MRITFRRTKLLVGIVNLCVALEVSQGPVDHVLAENHHVHEAALDREAKSHAFRLFLDGRIADFKDHAVSLGGEGKGGRSASWMIVEICFGEKSGKFKDFTSVTRLAWPAPYVDPCFPTLALTVVRHRFDLF